MKTISEMSQDEKTELLKTIEENRLDKIKTLKEDDDFLVNPIMVVKSLKRKNSKEKIVNTYKVLLNASFPFSIFGTSRLGIEFLKFSQPFNTANLEFARTKSARPRSFERFRARNYLGL